MGFEPMVRSRESLVFKTSSINHSDTSPQWLPPNASIILAWKSGLVKPALKKTQLFLSCFAVRRHSQAAHTATSRQSQTPWVVSELSR